MTFIEDPDDATKKEVRDLEFNTFFDHVVENVKRYYKINNSLTIQMVHVRKWGHDFLLPSITEKPPEGQHISSLRGPQFLINAIQPDFYVVASEAWKKTERVEDGEVGLRKLTQERGAGWIGRLPLGQKKEVVMVVGGSMDGRNKRSMMFDIIREDPMNEESKVLELKEWARTDKPGEFMSDFLP